MIETISGFIPIWSMLAVSKNISYQVEILMFFMKRGSPNNYFVHHEMLIVQPLRSASCINGSLMQTRKSRVDAWVGGTLQ